jgi:diguanylate cyclase
MTGQRKLTTYLAVQGLAAAGSFLLPIVVGGAVRLSVALAGVITLIAAVLGRHPKRRAGWWLVALSAVFAAAIAVAVAIQYGLGHGERLDRISQFVLVILSLLALAAGLAVLGWGTADRRGWDALDASMTALGAFLIAWELYIDPSLQRSHSASTAMVGIAIPAASLLVFALAVKLVFGGALSTWSGRMLLLATVAALCTSAFVYFQPITTLAVPIGMAILLPWMAHSVLLGGTGLSVDFVDVVGAPRRPASDLPRWRLVLFASLALLAPLDVGVDVARAGGAGPQIVAILVPPICAMLILLLLVIRLALIAKVAEVRADELADQSASLARAVTEQDELQRELAFRALHDPLTGVANRYVLTDRMDQLAAAPASRGQALMMLDLDGFKDVNDTFGHPVGDQVLIDAARRLIGVLPAGSVLARLGGDEFGALVENVPGGEARRIADAVVQALRSPFGVSGHELLLSVSVGLVVTEVGARPLGAAEGLRDVDQALYAAKAAGRNRVSEFYPKLLDERLHLARLTTELRHAVSRKELTLHYQPIVALDDGHVIGVEALARWPQADGEMVPPAEFIPAAEQAGLISDIGAWVLRQACRDAASWYIEHGITIAVNVSGRQLDDSGFAELVLETLADTGLPGSALTLELTETSLIENTADPIVRAELDHLREHGVQVAIDDFGTGYSSLSYITRLPVDLVKIDSSFTPSPVGSTVPHQPWTVVRAILQLMASLNLSAVAEGIETREQADVLRQLKCTYGQGYYFSPPVPADRIVHLLRGRAAS